MTQPIKSGPGGAPRTIPLVCWLWSNTSTSYLQKCPPRRSSYHQQSSSSSSSPPAPRGTMPRLLQQQLQQGQPGQGAGGNWRDWNANTGFEYLTQVNWYGGAPSITPVATAISRTAEWIEVIIALPSYTHPAWMVLISIIIKGWYSVLIQQQSNKYQRKERV